jgi:hypothetical protein
MVEGPGCDFGKAQGLLNKIARGKLKGESDPLDQDPSAGVQRGWIGAG